MNRSKSRRTLMNRVAADDSILCLPTSTHPAAINNYPVNFVVALHTTSIALILSFSHYLILSFAPALALPTPQP